MKHVCLDMHPCRDVLMLNTCEAPLPLAMHEAYLLDLQAWVVDACRKATRADRAATSLLDALFAHRSAASFARWASIGPHARLRRELGLSDDAIDILLLAAAPRMWGALTHVYAAIPPRVGVTIVNQHVLAALVGNRPGVLGELRRDAPLVARGLVSVRPTGSVVVSDHVIRRIAGN